MILIPFSAATTAKTKMDNAKLIVDDKEYQLPLVEGTEGNHALDISKLQRTTGLITLDEGYSNTGSTRSAITLVDGENGVLRYRGYPVEVIAERCDFAETAYLLIYGELPTPEQLEEFRKNIRTHTLLHEGMKTIYAGFPPDAQPMAILSSVVGALPIYCKDSLDPRDPEQQELAIYRILAKMPTIAAFGYKQSIGQPFIYPRKPPDILPELPAHDVRHAQRTIPDGPRFCRRLEPAV